MKFLLQMNEVLKFFSEKEISEERSSKITNIISNFWTWKMVSIENIRRNIYRHLLLQSHVGQADKGKL